MKNGRKKNGNSGGHKGNGGNGSPQSGPRLFDQGERQKRQKIVSRLRFARRWKLERIAEYCNVGQRTIDRDLVEIRKAMRERVNKNLQNELRDIADDMLLSHDEKMEILWDQYEALAVKKNGQYRKLGLQERYQVLAIFNRMSEVDESFIQQLAKLGFAKGDEGVPPSLSIYNFLGGSDHASKSDEEIKRELDQRVRVIYAGNGRPAHRF